MRSVLVFGMFLGLAAPAFAQDNRPAALVDSISVAVPGVQAMDYVRAGTAIDLGADGKLVIDYLASCIREEIVGGKVQVGTQQSTVDKGKVNRKRVECDGAELQIAAGQSDRGGTVTYRSAMNKGPDGLPLPDINIGSRAPFVIVSGPGTIRIERLDVTEAALELKAEGTGRIGVDVAAQGVQLAAGGLYRVTAGERSMVFRVDANAGGAEVARVARLLPL